MTKREALVHIVAGLGHWTPDEGKVEHAEKLLAGIEKVCVGSVDRSMVEAYKKEAMVTEEMLAEAVAAEREACAKVAIAERTTWLKNESAVNEMNERTPCEVYQKDAFEMRQRAGVASNIAAAIRARGQ